MAGGIGKGEVARLGNEVVLGDGGVVVVGEETARVERERLGVGREGDEGEKGYCEFIHERMSVCFRYANIVGVRGRGVILIYWEMIYL